MSIFFKEDITKGYTIAGTGTMEEDGTVGGDRPDQRVRRYTAESGGSGEDGGAVQGREARRRECGVT